jgi:hypothetical protein
MGRKKIAECPEDLKELIDLVNLLPANADQILNLIEEKEIHRQLLIREPKPIRDPYEAHQREPTFEDIVQSLLDRRIADYCLDSLRHTFSDGYHKLLHAISYFRHCAALYRKFPDWGQVTAQKQKEYEFRLNFGLIDPEVMRLDARMIVNSEGFMKPWKPEFMEIFEKANIPFFRIRECVICPESRIFWARRIGTQYCDQSKCKASYAADIRRDNELNRKLKNAERKLSQQREQLKETHPLIQVSLSIIADLKEEIRAKEHRK